MHQNGNEGEKLLPETMGGTPFFDFDNDGNQDLLLINSSGWPWNKERRLRNGGSSQRWQGHFTDVTAAPALM